MFRFTCNSLIGYGTAIGEHLWLFYLAWFLLIFVLHLFASAICTSLSDILSIRSGNISESDVRKKCCLIITTVCMSAACASLYAVSRWDVFNCSSLAKTQAMLGNTTVGLRCGLFFDVSLVCQGLYCIRTGRSESEFRHRVRQHWHSHFTEHPDSRFSFLDSWIVTPCVWMMQLVKN